MLSVSLWLSDAALRRIHAGYILLLLFSFLANELSPPIIRCSACADLNYNTQMIYRLCNYKSTFFKKKLPPINNKQLYIMLAASERTSIAFVEQFMIFSHGELSDTENSFQRCFACFIHAHVNIVRRKSQQKITRKKALNFQITTFNWCHK